VLRRGYANPLQFFGFFEMHPKPEIPGMLKALEDRSFMLMDHVIKVFSCVDFGNIVFPFQK
jgi:hypothetical protein